MKRISFCPQFPRALFCAWGLVALLAFLPGSAKAYYGCYGYSIRYSPYALSYHRSGLVNGAAEYTPYGFSYYTSGLVPYYGFCEGYDLGYAFRIPGRHHGIAPRVSFRAPVHVSGGARGGHRPVQRCDATPGPRPKDGIDVIRQHLRSRGYASVSFDRICRINNELVSVDVLVRDRNLLIKYWDPEAVQRLDTKDARQQRTYAKYKQDWERFAERYQRTGGEIYPVNASTPETIVAALDSCTKLGPGHNATRQPVLYAKE